MAKKRVMKKSAKRLIAVVIAALCCLFAFIYFQSSRKPEEPVTEPIAETNTAAPENDSKEQAEPTSEATIQESQGDLIITIPDDQESAGE